MSCNYFLNGSNNFGLAFNHFHSTTLTCNLCLHLPKLCSPTKPQLKCWFSAKLSCIPCITRNQYLFFSSLYIGILLCLPRGRPCLQWRVLTARTLWGVHLSLRFINRKPICLKMWVTFSNVTFVRDKGNALSSVYFTTLSYFSLL